MKIRNGFVSNSSSSSFVIAYKKTYANDNGSCTCPTCGNSINIVKLLKFIDRDDFSCSDERKITFIIENNILANHCYNDEYYNEEIKPIIDDFFKANNKEEYDIMGARIGYSESFLSDLIESDKNIHILQRENE
jgi:hypothetical protein